MNGEKVKAAKVYFVVCQAGSEDLRAHGELVARRCWELGLRNSECVSTAALDEALAAAGCLVLTDGVAAQLSAEAVSRLGEWVQGGGALVVIDPPETGPMLKLCGLQAQARPWQALPGEKLQFEARRAVAAASGAGNQRPAADANPPLIYPVWGAGLGAERQTAGVLMTFADQRAEPAVVRQRQGAGCVLGYLFTLGYTLFRNQNGRGIEHLSPAEDRQRRNIPPTSAWMWDWCSDIVRYPTQCLAHQQWWGHPFSDGLLWPLVEFARQASGHPPLVYWIPEGRKTCFVNTADSDSATDEQILQYALHMQQRRLPTTIFLLADQPHARDSFRQLDPDLLHFGIHHSPAEMPIPQHFKLLAEGGFEPIASRGHGLQWHGISTTARRLMAGGVCIDSTHGLCGSLNASWYFFVDGTTAPHTLSDDGGQALDLLEVTVPFLEFYGSEHRRGEEFDLERYINTYKHFHAVWCSAFHPVWVGREPRWSPMLAAMDRLSADPEVWFTCMEHYRRWWEKQRQVKVEPAGERWELDGPQVPGLALLESGVAEGSGLQLTVFGKTYRVRLVG